MLTFDQIGIHCHGDRWVSHLPETTCDQHAELHHTEPSEILVKHLAPEVRTIEWGEKIPALSLPVQSSHGMLNGWGMQELSHANCGITSVISQD